MAICDEALLRSCTAWGIRNLEGRNRHQQARIAVCSPCADHAQHAEFQTWLTWPLWEVRSYPSNVAAMQLFAVTPRAAVVGQWPRNSASGGLENHAIGCTVLRCKARHS